MYVQKNCAFNVVEIDYKGQFQQHFMSSFYFRRSQKHKKIVLSGSLHLKAFRRMFMKLTPEAF